MVNYIRHTVYIKRRVHKFLRGFAESQRGAVAVIVAVVLPILVGVTFGAVDFSRAMSSRQVLQDGLDAATLFAARSTAVTDAELQAIGSKAMTANMLNLHDGALVSVSFVSGDSGQKVIGVAQGVVPTSVLGLVGIGALDLTARTEVMRSSKNLEVALVLDTTGSMRGQNIIDMKAAAADLIDIVVRDAQTPFYSKVALVPYSLAVNVGPYAVQARGAIAGEKTITGATRANPVVITAAGHGFANGDKVYISGVKGMTQLNGKLFTVANRTTNSFQLQNVNGWYYNYYSSGGSVSCTTQGCPYYSFSSPYGNDNTFAVSSCVSERTGSNAYTEAAPSTALLGRNYPSPDNPCLQNTITPLSSDKAALKASLNVLEAEGSTGGHIGIAWGWYMLSPNFGYLWPGASAGAAYTAPDLIKAVVIMTDGEYNSVYCNGVISRNSTTGSGSIRDHESCDAPNGSSYYQSGQICSRMRAAGVIVYVVGFKVVNTQNAATLIANCATDSTHVYYPETGTDLKTAFRSIGQDLSRLRIYR
ncbi:MAG: hypothetical protein B7Y99_10970 [Caulobacterales bacterium 32-69-10]|nr:MAG: hypothetical protein B7Y99_10970 [Caulobacterales bacterium 32-69-10]